MFDQPVTKLSGAEWDSDFPNSELHEGGATVHSSVPFDCHSFGWYYL